MNFRDGINRPFKSNESREYTLLTKILNSHQNLLEGFGVKNWPLLAVASHDGVVRGALVVPLIDAIHRNHASERRASRAGEW